MNEDISIVDRKPIWVALSDFYLDTELQDDDLRGIASDILSSPYTLDEVKRIDKYEVFPVLYLNLLSMTGEWAGFNSDWLITAILESLSKRNLVRKKAIELTYFACKGMYKDYWIRVEVFYNTLKNNSNNQL